VLSLIFRYIHILLLIGGLILAGFGITKSLGKIEEAPTTVSIEALEKEQWPADAKWLKVTDGVLYWPASYKFTKTSRRRTGSSTTTVAGYYVPLVSKASAGSMFLSGMKEGSKPSFANVRVMVFVSESDLKAKIKDWSEDSDKLTDDFVAEGTIEPLTKAMSELKSKLSGDVASLDINKINVLEHGDTPLQRSGAVALVVIGLLMTISGGAILLVKRAKKGSTPTDGGFGGPGGGHPQQGNYPPTAGYAPPGGYPPTAGYAPQQQPPYAAPASQGLPPIPPQSR
jgi:hypothetical protein